MPRKKFTFSVKHFRKVSIIPSFEAITDIVETCETDETGEQYAARRVRELEESLVGFFQPEWRSEILGCKEEENNESA